MTKIKFKIGDKIIEIDKEKATQGIEAGTIELDSTNLVVYGKEDFETFKTNIGKEEYEKGKLAGSEMPVKNAKEKHNLEFKGKTIDDLLEAFKTKVIGDAKIEPDKKIQELEADKKALQTNFSTLQTEFNTFKSDVDARNLRIEKDNRIAKLMPSNLIVDQDIALLALKTKTGLDVEIKDGNSYFTLNGQIQKDTNTLAEQQLTSEIIAEKLTSIGLIKKNEGGSGGADEPGGGGASGYDKFVKEMKGKGISEGSLDFNEEMNKRISDKTLEI